MRNVTVWSQVLAHGFFKDFFYVQVLNFLTILFQYTFKESKTKQKKIHAKQIQKIPSIGLTNKLKKENVGSC